VARAAEDGIHTGDIYTAGISKQRVNTREFTSAVIERLGAKPEKFAPMTYGSAAQQTVKMDKISLPPKRIKKLVGVDVFLDWRENSEVSVLANKLLALNPNNLKLSSIDSRGLLVWPQSTKIGEDGDHWRCRFMASNDGADIDHEQIVSILQLIRNAGLDFVKTENLYTFGGDKGFTVAQGQ
jgi:isocitrate dehydrogenase